MKVIVGQRPQTPQRSWKIMHGLAEQLGGKEVNRNTGISRGQKYDLYMQWGWRLTPALDSVVKANKPYVVIDGGYFHDRDVHFSLNINGFQSFGHPYVIQTTGARTERPKVQQWRKPGDLIIVYGQVPTDRSLRGLDHEQWVRDTCERVEHEYPKHQVGFRPHPKSQKPHLELPPLFTAYDRQHLAVTYTSTAGVQTTLAGIPTVVGHQAAIAAPVASATLSRMRWPGRNSWADRLTWFQYHDSEPEAAAEFLLQHRRIIVRQAELGHYDLEGIRP